MKISVVWFEIYVDDIDRATKFYEAVLDTKLEALSNPANDALKMMSFPSDMEKYGSGGTLSQVEGVEAGGNSTLVYFGCEDCAIEESRVTEAGGKVTRPKMAIGEHGFVSLCIDSEGNMFGLHSFK